jgi:hypothetical protein
MGWWLDDRTSSASDGADDGAASNDLQSAPESAKAEESDSAPSAASGSSGGATAQDQDQDARQFALSEPAPEETGSDGGPTFFDDGGWIAIALMLTCALFLVLAWFLQRKLVPKPLDPDSAESGVGLP